MLTTHDDITIVDMVVGARRRSSKTGTNKLTENNEFVKINEEYGDLEEGGGREGLLFAFPPLSKQHMSSGRVYKVLCSF